MMVEWLITHLIEPHIVCVDVMHSFLLGHRAEVFFGFSLETTGFY